MFVDTDLRPHPDQWGFLASIEPMPAHDIEPTIPRATGGVYPLDMTFIDDEDLATPWKQRSAPVGKLTSDVPLALTAALANRVYFEKVQLPRSLTNRQRGYRAMGYQIEARREMSEISFHAPAP